MKKYIALAAALMLAGCMAPAMAPAGSMVDVTGPVIEKATYGLKGYASSVRVPFELKRLDHIDVYLTNVSENAAAVKVGMLVPYNMYSFNDADHEWAPIRLQNLKPHTDYSVTLRGFQLNPRTNAVEEVTDTAQDFAGSVTPFSTVDTGSGYTDASRIEQSLSNGFAIKLADQDFAGTAGGGIANDDGELVHAGAEGLGGID